MKNYCFGAAAPVSNFKSVSDQMFFAHRYRNRLVELELARRAASEEVIRRLHPGYAELAIAYDKSESMVELVLAEIRAASAKARTKVPPTDDQKKRLADAKANRLDALKSLKSAKAEAYSLLRDAQAPLMALAAKNVSEEFSDEEVTPTAKKKIERAEFLRLAKDSGVDAGQQAYEQDLKASRAACGCFWGTYLVVEDAAKDFGKGPPPRFKKWDHDGTIAVQLMGGLPVADAIGCSDSRLRIHLSNEEELETNGSSRYSRAVGRVQMRIGSDESRGPIWAEIPVTFHRPLPRNGIIRWAYLHRRRCATKDQWQLRLTIDDPNAEPRATVGDGTGRVAVHPGWRMLPCGSLRVATWIGSDGRSGSIELPPLWLDGDSLPDHLASVRSQHFNAIVEKLKEWFSKADSVLPDWLDEASKTIHAWKSASRLSALILKWRENRVDGDGVLWQEPPGDLSGKDRHDWHKSHCEEYLESWRKQDKHLFEWQENQRRGMLKRRENLYRIEAKRLASQYNTVILAKINWAAMLTAEADDEPMQQTNRQRHYGRLAAPGTLTSFIREAFCDRVIEVSGSDITRSCHGCGQINSFDRRKREHCCTCCAKRWGQDENAARNMLVRASVMNGGQPSLASQSPSVVMEERLAVSESSSFDGKEAPRKTRRNRRRDQLIR